MKELNNYVGYKDIISQIDIKEGDIICVSSDVLRLICVCRENNEKFDPNTFIDTIIKKIGDKGTLLFPTTNWGFCKGTAFDYYHTLSQVGAINNVALKRKDFKRTKHPIYSFVVWGYDQDYLCNLNNISAWGADSPFAYLYERRAKNFVIGIDYKDGIPLFHYVEEKVGVSYRFFKDFTAPYIGENGEVRDSTYRMYVRDLSLNVVPLPTPLMDDVLLTKGYYLKYSINGIYFALINMHGIGDIIEHDIRTKGGLVYLKKID